MGSNPYSPQGFSVQVDHHVDSTLMHVVGELDLAGAESFRQQVLDGISGMPVVLDLRGLTFLDTMGLAVLLDLASNSPRPVKLVQGPPNVQRIFQLTNTESRLEWQDPEAH